MMNKRGFTLAEVLITLGIIGVIAAMTVPTLMNNSTEMEFRSAFKKGLASLNQAVTMNIAIDNVDFDSLTSDDTEHTDYDSLYAMLVNRMSTSKFIGSGEDNKDAALLNIGNIAKVGTSDAADGSGGGGDGNVAMFFTDGSCIVWNQTEAADEDRDGIKALWDVNGSKKPNRLSWCDNSGPNGKPNKTTKAEADNGDVECTDNTVVVRDQFSIRLKGNRAIPNGKAAHYLFYMK